MWSWKRLAGIIGINLVRNAEVLQNVKGDGNTHIPQIMQTET
jgi:hypothetical protein